MVAQALVPERACEGDRWRLPLTFLAAGRRDEAKTAASAIPASPRDLLYEAHVCLQAIVAIGLDDRPTMARLYTELRPAAEELADAKPPTTTARHSPSPGEPARHTGPTPPTPHPDS